jgi:hypothetical protein
MTSNLRPHSSATLLVAMAAVLAACSAVSLAPPPSAADSPRPQGTSTVEPQTTEPLPEGLSEKQAVELARPRLAHPESEVARTMAGPYLDVFAALSNRPGNQPDPEFPAGTEWVWGIKFNSDIEICGPAPASGEGDGCEVRRGQVTVFLDYGTGTWLRTTSFAH